MVISADEMIKMGNSQVYAASGMRRGGDRGGAMEAELEGCRKVTQGNLLYMANDNFANTLSPSGNVVGTWTVTGKPYGYTGFNEETGAREANEAKAGPELQKFWQDYHFARGMNSANTLVAMDDGHGHTITVPQWQRTLMNKNPDAREYASLAPNGELDFAPTIAALYREDTGNSPQALASSTQDLSDRAIAMVQGGGHLPPSMMAGDVDPSRLIGSTATHVTGSSVAAGYHEGTFIDKHGQTHEIIFREEKSGEWKAFTDPSVHIDGPIKVQLAANDKFAGNTYDVAVAQNGAIQVGNPTPSAPGQGSGALLS